MLKAQLCSHSRTWYRIKKINLSNQRGKQRRRPKSKRNTATASSHIKFTFRVNLIIFQSRDFLLPPNNFQLFQLSTYLLITIIIWAFRLEGNFIQTLLIQRYSLLEVKTSELNTPFPIKDFISICRDLNFFDVTLPLFCKCCRLE